LFWGDERYVPHDHPKSNVRMVRDTLLSERSVPPSNVHPIPVGPSPDAAAAAYTNTLQRFFDSPRQTFDTALLGLGSDGHTASLFPESLFPETSLSALEDWVGVVEAPPRHDVSTRLTCTLPVLNGASEVIFLVSGARKHDALTGVVDQHDAALPATHVQAREATRWFVDEAAYTGRA
jgi:6-phosphogluconolactonase